MTGGATRGEGATKGERTRRAIVETAIAQFASAGHRGASVPVIAREVGLTPSAVYAYFATKQDLFEAAVDADVASLIADALPEMVAGRFDGDFLQVFARLLAALPDHPLARRVLATGEGNGFDRLILLPAEQRLNQGLSSALAAGQAAGVVRPDIDPAITAVGLETIVVALLSVVVQSGRGPADRELTDAVIAVLDASLRPAPPAPPAP